ncbi:MAG TPA: histidine kinase [Planctomycetaceae bacterium]|nr:histidine kinase [Planctomycetaceae bacterium]HBC60144.1 histidine kinase [Planctomycetaceae bacterium]
MVKRRAGEQEGPRLLAGGNPQMAKGDGDAVVQQWIAAMPGWKQDVGRRLDALIVSAVPDVRKAVRWNTPFYGLVGNGWFMAFHCLTKYVKVAIFRGTSLNPVPPVSSKQPNVRYVHLTETEAINWQQIGDWVLQASRLPGDRLF